MDATVTRWLGTLDVVILTHHPVLDGTFLVLLRKPPDGADIPHDSTTTSDVLHARELHLRDKLKLELDGRHPLESLCNQRPAIQATRLLSKSRLECVQRKAVRGTPIVDYVQCLIKLLVGRIVVHQRFARAINNGPAVLRNGPRQGRAPPSKPDVSSEPPTASHRTHHRRKRYATSSATA